MHLSNNDNLYPVGTVVKAKVDPTLPLIIEQYNGRIYYCAAVDTPEHRHFAYFERELIPPVAITENNLKHELL
jgi:hypothetical protein